MGEIAHQRFDSLHPTMGQKRPVSDHFIPASKEIRLKPERLRRHGRTAFHEVIRLSWQDRTGLMCTVRGRGIDRSPSGLRAEAAEPIEVGTLVQVQAERFGFIGGAHVRHCARKGSRYVWGLQFTQDIRWKDDPEQPGAK
jgi:hypothetical protein